MAERHADSRIGHHAVVEMQVRPTDCCQRHLDNCVVGVLQRGNVFFLDPDLVRSAVNHCPHSASRHSESPSRRLGVPSEALLTHRAANLSASVTKDSQPARSKPIRIEPINLPPLVARLVCSGHPGGWRVHARRTKIPNGPGKCTTSVSNHIPARSRCTTRVSPRKASAPILRGADHRTRSAVIAGGSSCDTRFRGNASVVAGRLLGQSLADLRSRAFP